MVGASPVPDQTAPSLSQGTLTLPHVPSKNVAPIDPRQSRPLDNGAKENGVNVENGVGGECGGGVCDSGGGDGGSGGGGGICYSGGGAVCHGGGGCSSVTAKCTGSACGGSGVSLKSSGASDSEGVIRVGAEYQVSSERVRVSVNVSD